MLLAFSLSKAFVESDPALTRELVLLFSLLVLDKLIYIVLKKIFATSAVIATLAFSYHRSCCGMRLYARPKRLIPLFRCSTCTGHLSTKARDTNNLLDSRRFAANRYCE
jgi:hypothetical protein